jgi:hypothetical protein
MAFYEKDIESLEIRVIEQSKMIGDVYVFTLLISFIMVFLMVYLLNESYFVNNKCNIPSYDINYLLTAQ